MKEYTLGFLFKGEKIILAKKKRKFGVGKWNGYGGRIEEGENLEECLIRETEEECKIKLDIENCKKLGLVDFHFENQDQKNQKVYIYRIDKFEGEPKETDEMGKPEEFDVNEIPYHEMIIGDDKFIPFVVENKKFEGKVYFDEKGEKILKYDFNELN